MLSLLLSSKARQVFHTIVLLTFLLSPLARGSTPLPVYAKSGQAAPLSELSPLPQPLDSPLTLTSPLTQPATEPISTSVTLASYATTEDNGWRLLYNPPVVSTFSGAATYRYTFDLPPARDGLQPSLQLSYNSRRVDGVLGWWASSWVGMGWSVDLVDILREGVEYCWHDNTEWICYDNRFTLLINGTGYELEPAAGVTAGRPGRYDARNAPQLYVELRDDAPPDDEGGNKTGLYWLVKTPDGTEYRLGYTTNSEQVLCRTPNGEDWYGGGYDAGRAQNFATYRWRVDSVRDVYGNRMEVTYREPMVGLATSGIRPASCRRFDTTAGPERNVRPGSSSWARPSGSSPAMNPSSARRGS